MQHLGLGLAISAVALLSCTVDNPHYSPEIGNGDLAGRSPDLFGTAQLDLAIPSGACSADQRSCTAVASRRCEAGMFVTDRVCPTSSVCVGGACQPPPSSSGNIGKSCAPLGLPSETMCTNGGGMIAPSCEPFLVPVNASEPKISWVCAAPIGGGLPGTTCNAGSQCRSGFCGSNGTCFRGCSNAAECPGQGSWKCQGVAIVVDGHAVQAASCIPG